jgi:hypothetical protein
VTAADDLDRPQLVELIGELLKRTSMAPLPATLSGKPFAVVIGLFGAARAHLDAMLQLHRGGLGHVAAPVLTRAVFEHVVTLTWILKDVTDLADLNGPVTIFRQDSNRALEAIATETGSDDDRRRLEDNRSAWISVMPDVPFVGPQLPSMRDRLTGPMESWYDRYRRLSLRSHPTLESVELALASEDDTIGLFRHPPSAVELAFAGMHVFYAAIAIDTTFKAPIAVPDGDLAALIALSAAINSHLQQAGPPTGS